ncbi:MAG TPA: DUF6220 domain-containing protein [Hydrogenophaga sp.]|nr:DUF6220 domain-containing protein [Hydrogenophaga sp.]
MNAAMPSTQPVTRFAFSASLALLLVFSQFAWAGGALFVSPALWAAHGMAGFAVSLPLMAMLVQCRRGTPLAALRPAVWGLFALYLLQVMLAVAFNDGGMNGLRAVHATNAALVLCFAAYVAQRAWALARAR